MSTLGFRQVDVFTDTPLLGNPVAVVHDADGWSEERMQAFARWTNLSETTFLLAPTRPDADYRLRIFTPTRELPFAGHPTLGSAHAWLEARDARADADRVVQECAIGTVHLRVVEGRLLFAAPPLVVDEPATSAQVAAVARALRIAPEDVVDARVLENGPRFAAVRLCDADAVLALEPDWSAFGGLEVGAVGLHAPGGEAALEVRVFGPDLGFTEDPVTGSFNAAAAQWLTGDGTLPPRYVAAQGTAIGRRGRVHVTTDAGGSIWVGGDAVTTVHGAVTL